MLDWTAYVIFIVVIGGIGTIEGPILGAIIFVVLQSTLSSFGPWYLIILGALGIAVMLVAPKGLWGTFSAATGIHLFPTRRRLVAVADDTQGGLTMGTRDFDEHSITDAVVERFADTPDPRLKQILTSLVRHAHDFVRDVELTQDEWFYGDQVPDPRRPHVATTSGRSSSCCRIRSASRCWSMPSTTGMPEGATETTVLGPFYVQDPPVLEHERVDLPRRGRHAVPCHRARHLARGQAAARRDRRRVAVRR